MGKLQTVIHLHNTSAKLDTTKASSAGLQVGELAMYIPTGATDAELYVYNSTKNAIATFQTADKILGQVDTKITNSLKDYTTTAATSTAIANALKQVAGADNFVTGSTSAATTVAGAKAYTDAKISGLDSSATTTAGSVFTTIKLVDGKLSGCSEQALTVKKTAGTAGDTYQFMMGSTNLGDAIQTYKDTSLEKVEWKGTGGTDAQILVFTYKLADGTTNPVEVDFTKFFNELEVATIAGAGLSGNGSTINIVKSSDSESYLTINADSITVKGIDKAIADADTALKNAIIGTTADTSGSTTITGAKKYADAKASAVVGTSSDAASANTVYGAKKYADAAAAKMVSSVTMSVNDSVNLLNLSVTPTTAATGATSFQLKFEDNGLANAISGKISGVKVYNGTASTNTATTADLTTMYINCGTY